MRVGTDEQGLGDGIEIRRAALSLWGKSNQGGHPNLLLQHLFDTAAIGEIMWDRYLPDGVKTRLGAITDGQGRRLFALLCGLHDVGKATPIFQAQDQNLAQQVRAAGLAWNSRRVSARTSVWHHTKAGAVIVRNVLRDAGWGKEATWFAPLILGHHGRVTNITLPDRAMEDHGKGCAWASVQRFLVDEVARVLAIGGLESIRPMAAPSRGDQLALLGYLIMADWLASNDTLPGVDDLKRVGIDLARQRAPRAWQALDLRAGWQAGRIPEDDYMQARFGQPARGIQQAVVRVAKEMPAPGLMIVEAPMGEGKTKAALGAAEILAQRFGARGLFVGMPTQATSDPMFDQVHAWSRQVAPGIPIVLLHGRRRYNKKWKALAEMVRVRGIDEYGCDDDYGTAAADGPPADVVNWLLGRKRGLLTPIAVGTIDNLLHAGTRTKHVMLRHAGLAGKVVVLDEVHAASVYMSEFLQESLRWLASARTPVILLTATLPPPMRESLVRAYLQGIAWSTAVDLTGFPTDLGYPGVLAVTEIGGQPVWQVESAEPWRDSLRVQIDVLDDGEDPDGCAVAEYLREPLADGGCALVIRNTVKAAQQTYRTLCATFGGDVVLLHARYTSAERAERTERELGLLGAPGGDGPRRPRRHILVATQLAEQSFDVDADILVSDLVPIDLLLQRTGRLHRHARTDRPERLRGPRLVVAGYRRRGTAAPELGGGSTFIYGAHRLYRAAALIEQATDSGGWRIPADVPALVARAYSDEPVTPPGWSEEVTQAEREDREDQQAWRDNARQFILGDPADLGPSKVDLVDLHRGSAGTTGDDEALDAVVREGERSGEALLLQRDNDGDLTTLAGRKLTTGGALVIDDDVAIEEAVGSLTRMPGGDAVAAALRSLPRVSALDENPQLRFEHVLVLDEDRSAEIDGYRVRYDDELGLIGERMGPR